MQIVDWRRALILWFQDKVEILEYHAIFARSAHAAFQVPSVLRLKRYIKDHNTHKIRFCRENVYLRDEYTCQYCHDEFERRDLTLDHVLPASKGGKKSWENVVTACRPCNQRKGNRTPEQARMPLNKRPREPHWLPQKELNVTHHSPENWRLYLVTTTRKIDL